MSSLKLATTPAELAKLKRDAERAGHASLAAYLRSLAGLSQRQMGGKRAGAGRPPKMKFTGYEAIGIAEAGGLTLNKYADPTEDAREGLTVEEAKLVASEDPLLIWMEQ